MNSGFFHYDFLNGMLIGSENPGTLPNAVQIVHDMVRRFGVRALITLTPKFVDFGTGSVRQYHKPLSDDTAPGQQQIQDVLDVVQWHLQREEPVWVHCQRGLDRTGCVVGCSLTARGLAPEAVIDELLARFPAYRRRPEFVAMWSPFAERIREFHKAR